MICSEPCNKQEIKQRQPNAIFTTNVTKKPLVSASNDHKIKIKIQTLICAKLMGKKLMRQLSFRNESFITVTLNYSQMRYYLCSCYLDLPELLQRTDELNMSMLKLKHKDNQIFQQICDNLPTYSQVFCSNQIKPATILVYKLQYIEG